jgi:hypothetical protein
MDEEMSHVTYGEIFFCLMITLIVWIPAVMVFRKKVKEDNNGFYN